MKDLDNILDRYFEGETTLDEERTLREYFRQQDIPEEYKVYAPMFRFFTEEKESGTEEVATKKKKRKLPIYIWSSVAACILLVITIVSIYNYQANDTSRSLVYIDGEKISDVQIINSQALISIKNISDIDDETLSSQIAVLDLFTE